MQKNIMQIEPIMNPCKNILYEMITADETHAIELKKTLDYFKVSSVNDFFSLLTFQCETVYKCNIQYGNDIFITPNFIIQSGVNDSIHDFVIFSFYIVIDNSNMHISLDIENSFNHIEFMILKFINKYMELKNDKYIDKT